MAVIAFAGQKGGAGKSTLAIASAAEFHRRGLRTLLVDADPQGTAATWGAIAAEREGYNPPVVVSVAEGFHRTFNDLSQGYAVTIIDCPGRIDSRQRAALAVADLVVIPLAPDTVDVWALLGSLDPVREIQRARGDGGPIVRILLNRMRSGTYETKSMESVVEQTKIPVFQTHITARVAFGRFAAAGAGVVEYEGTKGKAAQEMTSIVNELTDLCGLAPKKKGKART